MPQDKYVKELRVVELAKERNKRSPKQQLELLDQRLGINIGAKKERDRLKKQMGEQN